MSDSYVADRIALQDVMLKYALGVDERDFELYRACFADDVEVLGFGAETYHSADAWCDFVKIALQSYEATQHLMGPQLATVDGDTASARTNVQALHYLKDKPDTTMTLWAIYETDFTRLGGQWKIKRHRLVPRGMRTQSD